MQRPISNRSTRPLACPSCILINQAGRRPPYEAAGPVCYARTLSFVARPLALSVMPVNCRSSCEAAGRLCRAHVWPLAMFLMRA